MSSVRASAQLVLPVSSRLARQVGSTAPVIGSIIATAVVFGFAVDVGELAGDDQATVVGGLQVPDVAVDGRAERVDPGPGGAVERGEEPLVIAL